MENLWVLGVATAAHTRYPLRGSAGGIQDCGKRQDPGELTRSWQHGSNDGVRIFDPARMCIAKLRPRPSTLAN
eukprot:3888841-Prymnesium_polylepis.1